MRVKKLELVGFKSFAKKTTIHFEPGVTAIVGPNGSGKSNIVDAIRWVLGEHNPRDVRAPRLEDVIFNGTDRIAPLSMAEVSLTIDNEQGLMPISFAEITVTRRVYRSGESECLINQSPCRLKDIQELFLGTGLGGGTYAIIEQGHIDLVLSSKPEERRVVFEEASGVAKYLAKKQEAVRRLDETEEHLIRIADIISEVRRQVNALERAANKARQYKTQWEQLKQLELRLAADELTGGESRAHQLEQEVQALTAKRDALETQKQSRVSSLEGFNASVSAIQQKFQELRAQAMSCTSQIEQHESQSALKSRWIDELAGQILSLEAEAEQMSARAAQVDEQFSRTGGAEAELITQAASVKEQLAAQAAELISLEQVVRAVLEAVSAAKSQLFEVASDASHRRNALAEFSARLQSMDAQSVRLNEQQSLLTSRGDELRQRRDTLLRDRDTLYQQRDEIQQRITATQQTLDAASARRHELSGRLHQWRDQASAQRAKVGFLEDFWRRYEGFPDTVKALLGHSIEGVIGPLVDLVQAAPGYEEVVESALGPLAEAVVVRDREALARCRELLSAQELEACRFLVLSDCPEEAGVMEPSTLHEGVAGAVKQFVRAEAAYQPLVNWILNDSWIIDDVRRLLDRRPVPSGRWVSPRGERWDRRSWRLGVSRRGSVGRLGRKQQWEDARAALAQCEQELAQLESQTGEAERAWQSLLTEQESAKGEQAHLSPSLHKLDAQSNQIVHEIQRFEEEQRARSLELQELATEREDLQAGLTHAQQAVTEAEARQHAIEQSHAEAQTAREQAEQQRQAILIAKTQIEASLQSLTERLSTLTARRQELDADRTQLSRQIEDKTRQREEAVRRSGELSQQLIEHQQGRAQLEEARTRLQTEADGVSHSLQEEEAKRNQVVPLLLAVEQELSALMQQLAERSQQLSERTFRRTRLIERLRELYQIDEATLEAELRASTSALIDEQRTDFTSQVQKLRAKLEGMGPVSLGSVEEYDELKRRHEFLQTQQQDLIQARDDLKASISQINRTARTQFREIFERIRQEFKHYYARLFDGGEADLILLDPEDVLESGIDIVARPPGKRLQNISLLSGGERALTAVALLFSLFKVRPSPLCILDEIDAPLDEANVDRFTRVLEEFLALSQFILVTHNKKTITKADSLYGVTMEEPGISKILSAKFAAPARPAPVPTPVPA